MGRRHTPAATLAAAAAVAAAVTMTGTALAAPASGVATAVLLTDAAARGAVCLDGTPQRYWIEQGSAANASKWAVHFMGGGWCESVADVRACPCAAADPPPR
jgi:hypothetical protein